MKCNEVSDNRRLCPHLMFDNQFADYQISCQFFLFLDKTMYLTFVLTQFGLLNYLEEWESGYAYKNSSQEPKWQRNAGCATCWACKGKWQRVESWTETIIVFLRSKREWMEINVLLIKPRTTISSSLHCICSSWRKYKSKQETSDHKTGK